jgi:hypothetical protein
MDKFLKKPHTLAGFEPGIFCSVGGRDDHNTSPPGRLWLFGVYVYYGYLVYFVVVGCIFF